MKKIRFRVDSRLIHGQVIARWSLVDKTKTIIIADDEVAADEFMSDIYRMAAPQEIVVDVLTIKDAHERLKGDGTHDFSTMVLFKSIDSVVHLSNAGIDINELQIGGLPSGPGKKLVYKTIALSEDDFAKLDGLAKLGTKIYFQMLPEEDPMPYEKIKR